MDLLRLEMLKLVPAAGCVPIGCSSPACLILEKEFQGTSVALAPRPGPSPHGLGLGNARTALFEYYCLVQTPR